MIHPCPICDGVLTSVKGRLVCDFCCFSPESQGPLISAPKRLPLSEAGQLFQKRAARLVV